MDERIKTIEENIREFKQNMSKVLDLNEKQSEEIIRIEEHMKSIDEKMVSSIENFSKLMERTETAIRSANKDKEAWSRALKDVYVSKAEFIVIAQKVNAWDRTVSEIGKKTIEASIIFGIIIGGICLIANAIKDFFKSN